MVEYKYYNCVAAMRVATVLCALILFFHVSSSEVNNTDDCNGTASPPTPRNESASQSQEEEIVTPVEITSIVNKSDDCTNSTASSISTTESTSSAQGQETLISIMSTFPSNNSEDCTSTASPLIPESEYTSPSTEDSVASSSQPPQVTPLPPKGNQEPPMNNYPVPSTNESNTEDCTGTTSSSITTSGSTQTFKEEEKTTYTQTTSSAKSSENGLDTSPLSTVPPEGTLTPTKEEETSTHTPTTVTAKPQDCPDGNLMDGYSFFRRNVTLTMTNRTQEVGKGLEIVRCETSTLIEDMYAFKRVKRRFSYTNLMGLRNVTAGDSTTGTFDRPSATFIMQYSSNRTPPEGHYNHMKSAKLDSHLTFSLLSSSWDHLYTDGNCTVVKTYSRKSKRAEATYNYPTEEAEYHCQVWVVQNPLPEVKGTSKSIPSECCMAVYQQKCPKLSINVNDDRCYGSSENTVA